MLHSLKTNIAPENRPGPKRKRSYSKYPYQRTPMGNPYISPIYPYIVGVYRLLSPRIPNVIRYFVCFIAPILLHFPLDQRVRTQS